jgi:hypothetical protein
MSEEKHLYKDLFLFAEDIACVKEAILITQSYFNDEKNGTERWDAYCQKRIDELNVVLSKFDKSDYKELPTPNTLNK